MIGRRRIGNRYWLAHRDLHVTRRNVAELTQYLDEQAAQFAMCAGAAGEDSVPLMTMETFPRLHGDLPEAASELY